MKFSNFIALAFCCCFSVSIFAQKVDKTKPVYQGTVTSVEYVSSLASRPDDLKPADMTHKEAKDKRSLSEVISLGVDPQTEDDYYVKNRNPKEHSRASSPPSIVFDGYASGSNPTDPSLATGPNHVFVVFNTGFAIYDKSGVELVPQTAPNPAIFPSGGCCDLTVSYDNAADRWVLSFLGAGAQIAVSDGPDPTTAGWFVYTIAQIDDYQKLSVWSDGYYMTDQTGSADKVWVLERDEMLLGNPSAQIMSFDLPGISTSGFYSPQVFNVTNDDLPAAGGAPVVFLQDDAYSGVTSDHIKLWTIDVDWVGTGSTISAPQEIPTAPFISIFDGGSFVNLTQPGGGTDIDALQAIIMNQAHFRKFPSHNSAVFNFVVDTDAGTGELAGIRWVELRQSGDNMPWSLYQEGTYTAPDGRHAWNASLAMDANGSIGMGYTSMSGPTTATTVRVSSYYTSRLDGDPLGTMTGLEEVIANGDANIPGTRYGDYSKIDVDPSDDVTFWFINEYMNSGRKGVVGAFAVGPAPDYCESMSGDFSIEYIERVELNTIDNASAGSNYTDYTAVSTDLAEGETYTISVTPGWPINPDNEAYAVWIDYNNDLDFEDAGELVWSAAPNMTSPNVGSFTVPTGTSLSSVRMRVSMKWNDIPDPCETFSYGEVEDYTVNLIKYCDSAPGSAAEEYISNVTLNGINNNSGLATYSDFTGISTDLTEGNTYTISITPTWPGTVFNESYAVYIDYNDDIDFDDPGELVWSAASNTTSPNVGTFTVPTGTSLSSVRMRVSMTGDGAIPGPCETILFYGEVEDYTINLVGEPCYNFDSNDGESGWGIWVDGGDDAALVNNSVVANSGNYSFLLKDNTPTSQITTTNMDLTAAEEIQLSFNFRAYDFIVDDYDLWLQISTDGGATFTTVQEWFYGTDFLNNRKFDNVIIDGPFTANTQLRFRLDADGNLNKLYIDDIVIDACTPSSSTCGDGIQNGAELGIDCGGPDCAPCMGCAMLTSDDGETGWGIWNDGGLDAGRVNNAAFANSGTYSFLIKDDTESSHLTSDLLDMSASADATITFNYVAKGFNNSLTQDFWLQVSTDGGATYTTVREFKYIADFENDVRAFESVFIDGPFSSNTKIRFQCDATGNNDKIYIDDIVIENCFDSSATCDDGIQNQGETEIDCGGPNCAECDGCFDIGFNDFEANWGVWNDGGADCRRNPADAPFASSGIYCIRLQDDTGTSNMTTDNMDLSAYGLAFFDFTYFPTNFSTGEGFYAEYSTDGGATFTLVDYYEYNVDFTNGNNESVANNVDGPFTSTTQFRIRCNGNNNADRVYIDNVFLNGCYDALPITDDIATESRIDHEANLKSFTKKYNEKINVYPNPAQNVLTVDIEEGQFEEILIFASSGQLMQKAEKGVNKFDLDISEYLSGMYFIRFISSDGLAVTKRFVKE